MAEIILVASGKGGSGKSTFTVGVSKALASCGKKVLAIDCDIGLRSLDLLLGVSESVVFDWGDLLEGRCSAEQALIKGSVDLLAAPRAYGDGFTDEGFRQMVAGFDNNYDFIFLDSPRGHRQGLHPRRKRRKARRGGHNARQCLRQELQPRLLRAGQARHSRRAPYHKYV